MWEDIGDVGRNLEEDGKNGKGRKQKPVTPFSFSKEQAQRWKKRERFTGDCSLFNKEEKEPKEVRRTPRT